MEIKFKTSREPKEGILGILLFLLVFIVGLILFLFNIIDTPLLLIIGAFGLLAQTIDTFGLLSYYKVSNNSILLKYQFRKLDIPFSEIKSIERIEPEQVDEKFQQYISSDFLKNEVDDSDLRTKMLTKDYSDYITSNHQTMLLIRLHKGAEVLINPKEINKLEEILISKI